MSAWSDLRRHPEPWQLPLKRQVARRTMLRAIADGGVEAPDGGWRPLEWHAPPEVVRAHALAGCKRDVVRWVNDWVWTYDPRRVGPGCNGWLPFHLYPRQREYLRWLESLADEQVEGLLEKSRTVGASWLTGCFALHRWLWHPGFLTVVAANKAENVDKLGNSKSIFEKLRTALEHLPPWMLPDGFEAAQHAKLMLIQNPENENTISGESGDNIGRGGRASLLWVDEAAHVERSERVERATIAVANCRLWVSSVYGVANLFARKALGGRVRKFRLHYRDDPRMTQEVVARLRASTDQATWAQEYEIDYHASVEGLAVEAKWIAAARDLHDRYAARVDGRQPAVAGADIGGAHGGAKTVVFVRRGSLLYPPAAWDDPDTTDSAHRILDVCREAGGVRLLNYDPDGPGPGITATLRRARDREFRVRGVHAGGSPSEGRRWPDGKSSKSKCLNKRAEMWLMARARLQRTFEHWTWLQTDGEEGQEHDLDDLLLIPACAELETQLATPKLFRTETGKFKLESKEAMARRGVASPDYADAAVLTLEDAGLEATVTHETAVALGPLTSAQFDGIRPW